MDPGFPKGPKATITRSPAPLVQRLESHASISIAAQSKSQSKLSDHARSSSDESPSDASPNSGGQASSSSPNTPQISFSDMRTTVHQIRRRDHRTLSTVPPVARSTVRKVQYLKSQVNKYTPSVEIRTVNSFELTIKVLIVLSIASTYKSPGPRATSVRHKHTCTLIPGLKILVFYGGLTNAGTAPAQTMLTYDIDSGEWSHPKPVRKNASQLNELVLSSTIKRGPLTNEVPKDKTKKEPADLDGADESDLESSAESTYVPMKEQSMHLENRYSHSTIYWNGSLFIFGGSVVSSGTSSTLANSIIQYNWDSNEWWYLHPARSSPQAPQPRRGHCAVVYHDFVYIFGGQGAEIYNDVWQFNLVTKIWTKVILSNNSPSPSPRTLHSCVLSKFTMYVFGGSDGSRDLQELWGFNLEDWTWSLLQPHDDDMLRVPPKSSAQLGFYNDNLVLVGGSNPADDNSMDIYLFHLTKNEWSFLRYEEDSTITSTTSSHDTMGPRFVRSTSTMTVNNRNRIFHTAQVVADLDETSSCDIFIFGGVNGTLANILDQLSLTFSENSSELMTEVDQATIQEHLPKHHWEAAAMYYHPDVLSLIERMRILNGELSYSRDLKNQDKTQAVTGLGSYDVLMMVMEWLSMSGYSGTLLKLENDTRHQYVKQFNTRGSCLENLISFAKRRVKTGTSVWDDQILNLLSGPGLPAQAIDHLPDWYASISRDLIFAQNPWDEPIIQDANLKIDPINGHVLFASINALIVLAVDYPNFVNKDASIEELDDYLSCFFHTYHSYTTSLVVLQKLFQLFDVPDSDSLAPDDVNMHKLSILDLIVTWIDLASWDWTNEYLVMKLNEFIDGPLINSDLRTIAPEIRRALSIAMDSSNSPEVQTKLVINKGKVKSQNITTSQLMAMSPLPGTQRLRSVFLSQSQELPEPVLRKNIFSSQLCLDDIPELELARQLTIVAFSLFCMIKPSEMLNSWWKSDDAEYRSPHVRVCLHRHSIISEWAVSCFSRPCDDRKARGKAVERLFKVATHLRQLNNFETMSSILAALRQAPEDLIERVDSKELIDLYNLDSSHNHHHHIIDNLDALIPCVPNISHLLKEIGMIEGAAELYMTPSLKSGRILVNMHKCRNLHVHLRRIIRLQARVYHLLPVYQIITLLRDPGTRITEDPNATSLRIVLSPNRAQ